MSGQYNEQGEGVEEAGELVGTMVVKQTLEGANEIFATLCHEGKTLEEFKAYIATLPDEKMVVAYSAMSALMERGRMASLFALGISLGLAERGLALGTQGGYDTVEEAKAYLRSKGRTDEQVTVVENPSLQRTVEER